MNGIFNFSRPSIPCGPSTETVESGGGAATPVAEDFSSFLQNVLAGGGGGGGSADSGSGAGGVGADGEIRVWEF
ncbi:hypothetical protein LCGC14_1311770 [marine sediment metagenome]|uniref:Uncharacterized protein n=1 Tax=marine sediment metagenome TaxID=412755 RepID=A0A0F9KM39_9ZZZZ